ncbi:SDR family NAD(P)-dependent oxidoreductase [Myroides sp. M-43]|uniref:SDR family NAD(P)-dependent oxidoreductase n=1 Tax=Myroides oncorhynchi TaxID=2893756 RepID=UPI001E4B97FF|nr:SDR family NAD(P)-dependent oxidoreductase [Myroides oncorhynchi]MCC9043448.1 SDR family NAD(P)-dependent oxidoreductase [Myroides oncorhynchi]
MNSKTYLIYGVSKGLGKAITQYIPNEQDIIYGVSRSQPDYLTTALANKHWIAADLSNPIFATNTLKQEITDQKIDYFIYNVGIWEHNAFSVDYTFSDNTQDEIITMINTNISSCILMVQAFIENLKLSDNAKIILIGSTWGLDNHNGKEVAFSATKFALRGVIHALRENLREDNIGVSILNLGYLATEYGCEETATSIIEKSNGELIPLQDVLQAIRFIISTSKASCVKEINMPAMKDSNM